MSDPTIAVASTSRNSDIPQKFTIDDTDTNSHRRSSSKLVGAPLLYTITCFASLGVFLFGYDQGVMSGIITGPYFKSYFNNPDSAQLGTMVAILEIGALITSLLAGTIGDKIGRKRTLFWGATVFIIGGAIQTGSTSFMMMVLGRIISGFGVGLLSMIVPIELANHRGKLACIEFTGNITGYACSVVSLSINMTSNTTNVAQWLDYFSSYIKSDASWRLPLLFQCIIGGILALGSLVIPESPRWLLDNDQDDEGFRVLVDINGGYYDNVKADKEYREIRDAVEQDRLEPDRSYKCLFKKYKARVFIAMSSQLFAQLNGINVISYYMPLVMISAGWVGRDAILMTGINALVYIASTVPPWYLVDRWGRRFVLLSGAAVMCFALTLTGWWIYIDVPVTPTAVVICVIIFNAAFGFSWGPVPWLYPPEIMPLAFRAKGVSLSTASNWAANFIVGELTPILQDVIQWRLYPMHALFCACSFVLVYFLYPETANVPLEEMSDIFGDSGSTEEEAEQISLHKQNRIARQSSVSLPSLASFTEYDRRHRRSEPNLHKSIIINPIKTLKKWIYKGKSTTEDPESSDSYERLDHTDV
ncbi:hypothetical protein E3Q18_00459 [Wallemia mellicola]|nr:hypothetical protein E3Q18_00459 [Wallemia mellicola]